MQGNFAQIAIGGGLRSNGRKKESFPPSDPSINVSLATWDERLMPGQAPVVQIGLSRRFLRNPAIAISSSIRRSIEISVARVRSSLQAVIYRGEECNTDIAEIEGFTRLLKLVILETDQNLIGSILSFVIHPAGQKRVRTKLLVLGAVKSLSELLAAPSSAITVSEKALKLVKTISSRAEGGEALSSYERCIETVLQRAFKVSAVATEHAMTILWGPCYAAKDERTRAVVSRCSDVPRLAVVMQNGCTPAVRRF
ncbi:hypothetical protein SAY86_017320 [Trapa natans]|uniref:U-box domain-containing protein n=1 Tax=Trapa natans TaxID=22666 RepID=A0AAN7LP38_TRANT|nr:hypothetical protein SAY86_017320 [Trapa natans]